MAVNALKATIIQAEYFHVDGGRNGSLTVLRRQILERVTDGLEIALRTGREVSPGIKTGVRFRDTDGSVTTRVQEAERLEKKYDGVLDALNRPRNGRIMRWWYGRQLRRIGDRKRSAKAAAMDQSIYALLLALKAKEEVGIEKNDHSYRLLEGDETVELAERASASKNGSLFVFAAKEDLLSDTNSMIACIL
jgi:hypothetical protein